MSILSVLDFLGLFLLARDRAGPEEPAPPIDPLLDALEKAVPNAAADLRIDTAFLGLGPTAFARVFQAGADSAGRSPAERHIEFGRFAAFFNDGAIKEDDRAESVNAVMQLLGFALDRASQTSRFRETERTALPTLTPADGFWFHQLLSETAETITAALHANRNFVDACELLAAAIAAMYDWKDKCAVANVEIEAFDEKVGRLTDVAVVLLEQHSPACKELIEKYRV